ncbi:MAG: ZIP family metal transporter [bacterium]
MSSTGDVLLHTLINVGAYIAGAAALMFGEKWASRNSVYLTSFAVGILLGLCFLHLAPEAIENTHNATLFILLGFVVLFVIEYAIMPHEHHERSCYHANFIASAMFISIALHSSTDGIVIGIAFLDKLSSGVMTSLAMLTHQFPVGFSIFSILYHAGIKKKKLYLIFLLSVMPIPVVATLFFGFFSGISSQSIGALVGVSVGMLLYIVTTELIPETHRGLRFVNMLCMILGTVVMYALFHFTGGHH